MNVNMLQHYINQSAAVLGDSLRITRVKGERWGKYYTGRGIQSITYKLVSAIPVSGICYICIFIIFISRPKA